MGKIIKIKQVATVGEEDWLKVYSEIEEYKAIAEELGEAEQKRLEEYLEVFRKYAMEVLETNNYVTFAEIKGESDKIALVELDYSYTGERLQITKFFSEEDDVYVEAN